MSGGPQPQETPGPDANRRLPWLGALLIVVSLGALIWRAQDADVVEPAAAASSLAHAGESPSLGDMLQQAEVLRRAEAAASAAPSPPVPLDKDQVEVCGVGRVKADASGQPEDLGALQQPMRQARERLLQALAAGDEVSRAASLLLQSSSTPLSADAVASCVGAGCASDEAARQAASAAPTSQPPAQSVSARDALAHLAQSTSSAQVYAFALQACETNRKEGACQMLSAGQWARLDAGNAVPWLKLANEASERGDAGAVSEALFHVAQSRVVDSRVPALLSLGLSKVPADAPLLVRVGLASELQGVAIGGMPGYAVVSRYCEAGAMHDANRQQSCAALAETLVAHGTTFLDAMIGVTLGERAGWPAERVQALRDEHDAIYESVLDTMPAPGRIWGCDAQQRLNRYLNDVGSYGEMGALRRSLKQSAESLGVLALRHRERKARELLAVRAEASASQP